MRWCHTEPPHLKFLPRFTVVVHRAHGAPIVAAQTATRSQAAAPTAVLGVFYTDSGQRLTVSGWAAGGSAAQAIAPGRRLPRKGSGEDRRRRRCAPQAGVRARRGPALKAGRPRRSERTGFAGLILAIALTARPPRIKRAATRKTFVPRGKERPAQNFFTTALDTGTPWPCALAGLGGAQTSPTSANTIAGRSRAGRRGPRRPA
jgi:hypothetical protein